MAKTPADSAVEMTELLLPGDTNVLGSAFGGKIMHWMDIAAAVAARRHAQKPVVTAFMDSLQFKAPIHMGDIVTLRASVNRAWTSSMEVGVRVDFENGLDGKRIHAASGFLTLIAVDDQGKPTTIPSIEPVSESDLRRYNDAAIRRSIRLKERQRVMRQKLKA